MSQIQSCFQRLDLFHVKYYVFLVAVEFLENEFVQVSTAKLPISATKQEC